MKTYCFNVRNANNGQKTIGGVIHAESMEDAAKRAMRRCKVETVIVEHDDIIFRREHHLVLNGSKVYMYIGVHPENLTD
jgi:hypothetical protein